MFSLPIIPENRFAHRILVFGKWHLTAFRPRAKLIHLMNDIELAKEALRRDALAFALAKDGVILKTGTREGIGELIQALDTLGELAQGAGLADKIVGKAVAMVARHNKLRAVYSPLASAAARDALFVDGIPLEYDRLVPLILNKRNDGPCPMERLSLPIQDPAEAVSELRKFIGSRPLMP